MKPTNPLWYLAALLLALVSLMGATVVAAGGWGPVRESTVTSVTRARAEAAGKSLAVFTDTLQTDRTITCQATDTNKAVTMIPSKAVDITADSDGTRWHLIGMLREGSNGLMVRCRPTDRRTDNATYGFAAVTGYSSAVTNGTGFAVLGVAIGGGLATWIYYNRRQRKRWALIETKGRTGK